MYMLKTSRISNKMVIVGNETLEVVDKYIYLGHILSFSKEHPDKVSQGESKFGG